MIMLVRCSKCKQLKRDDLFGRSAKGNPRKTCPDCLTARRGGPLLSTPDPEAVAEESRRLELTRLIRDYAPIRFANTPESAVAYRALLAAFREYGQLTVVDGRVWRYERGADDIVTCPAFAPRRPAPARGDADEAAQPDQAAG